MMPEAIRQTFQDWSRPTRRGALPAPLSNLCVGLKCGGSDGFSGISANPAIGHTSDLLARLGAEQFFPNSLSCAGSSRI